MSNRTNPVIAKAREAARGEYAAEHERDYMVHTCEQMADATMRVLLTGLREQRQHAPGEQFGHLISVVPVSVIDELLAELQP